MESKTEVSKIKERALHLAAEIAETVDNNVPVLLLGLKDILDSCQSDHELSTLIRIYLWNYDVIRVTSLALKQDFTVIRGQWGTAASLCIILCQCCAGLELPEEPDYSNSFLPDVVENVLNIASKLLDNYSNSTLAEESKFLLDGFRDVINGLEVLYSAHEFLALKVIQSKRFMHILMAENLEISLFFMSALEAMWKANRSVLNQLSSETLHGMLDEIIFKISTSEESLIGRYLLEAEFIDEASQPRTIAILIGHRIGIWAATRLLLTATDRNSAVVTILLSKRYKGLKAYLSKWNNRGFDGDVRRLVSLLEAGTAAEAELMKSSRSATIIQAFFRGYRTRKKLQSANRGVTLLQRKFREKRYQRELKREQQREDNEKAMLAEQKKIQGLRSSMRKQLKMLESVPAREVNRFMQENQIQAASKIQAGFRGMICRNQIRSVKEELRRNKAARTIQRQFRRYLEQKKQAVPYPIPPGLTDARRVELQNKIVEHRERFPPKHRTSEELKELHDKAHALLASHLVVRTKTRKSEQKREALLTRLKMDTDLLLGAPRLQDVTGERSKAFKSRSAPVIAKAQLSHNEELRRCRAPWWKKLWDEDSVDSLHFNLKDKQEEQLNF